MMMNNPIIEYHEAIEAGNVTVGRWVRMFYDYVVEGLAKKRFFFEPKKTRRAIRFIETFCHHCEGRSDTLKLELWQKAVVAIIFGVVDEKGLRQFREIVIVIGRKNGKSLLAAAIIAYHTFCDGEYGAKTFCVAPKLDQADIVYSAFWQTVQKEPELKELVKPRKADYYIEKTNSSVKKIAFNAKKSDGFNPSLTVCDEIASWPGAAGLKQYEVMKSALGARRQPIILSISTSGYENEGIYDELIKRCTRFLMGDSREKRLAPLLYMIDDIQKWNDMEELKKANPNMGVSVSEDFLQEEIAVAEGSLSQKAEFITKHCNLKQNSSQAWLAMQDVEKACGSQIEIESLRNTYCIGGIDLSRTTDLTACIAIIEKNGKLNVLAHFFLPAERLQEATARDGLPYEIYVQRGLLTLSGDNFVDYHDCFNWFRMLVEQYQIYPLKIGYDRYTAQYLVQEMLQYGFHMDDVFQGFNLTPVIRETEGLIRDGAFNIGDNDLLKVHLLDMAIKTEAESGRCKPVKMSATAHIDGGAALLDAMTVRQKYYSEIGEQLKNE